MRLFKNKTVVGIVLIVLAFLLSFVASPLIEILTSRNVEVYRAKIYIPKGEIITADNIEIVEVGKYNLPTDIITDEALAIGSYADCDIQGGDYITATKLSAEIPFDDSYLSEIAVNKLAVSVQLNTSAAGLSGKLQAEDIISIFALPEQNNNLQENTSTLSSSEQQIINSLALAPQELQYVRVLAVVDKNENDIQADTNLEIVPIDADEQEENAEKHIYTVILEVNTTQATMLIGLNGINQLHCALVTRDAEQAKTYLAVQNDYFTLLANKPQPVPTPTPSEEETSEEEE